MNSLRRQLLLSAAGMAALSSAPGMAHAYEPISIRHKLGTTLIKRLPQRVAALEMNEVDFLDQLGVPVAGMVKDYVPHFLAMTSLQAGKYEELAEIAPALYYEVDFKNSEKGHIEVVKNHLLTLGRIFNREGLASAKAAELDAQVQQVRRITQGRPERAMIVLHNNGAFSSFGLQSRYGFVFSALGVKPASSALETSLHGQPISSEFIQQADPEILYVVDRTAVMERRPVINADGIANPLLRQTKAWKNGRVVFVDADAWYTTGASPSSLKLLFSDVLKGYSR